MLRKNRNLLQVPLGRGKALEPAIRRRMPPAAPVHGSLLVAVSRGCAPLPGDFSPPRGGHPPPHEMIHRKCGRFNKKQDVTVALRSQSSGGAGSHPKVN